MIAESLIYGIVLVALLIGTYTDFKVREVPDWLNYGLIFVGFGLRLIFTTVYHDWSYLLEGIFGFAAFLVLALLMFYAGQWGGGDSKMVMGLGAIIGLELSIDAFLIGFLVNIFIFGALFGLAFSVYLAILHRRRFAKEFNRRFAAKKREKWLVWAGTLALLLVSFFVPGFVRASIAVLAGMLFLSFYVFIYLKSVEKASMIRWVDPERLTEGDWVVQDVVVDGRRVCGPKDLGLEMRQIKKLVRLKKKKKIKKVLIKYGIPFVPSFLISFIVTYFYGNFVFQMLGII